MNTDEPDFRAHPPERRGRSTILLASGCCCCCCCFHSAGGLAGATWGSLRSNPPPPELLTTPEQQRVEAEKRASSRRAVKVYWLTLTILATITCIVTVAVDPGEAWIGPLLVAMFLPGGQLVASLLTLVHLHVFPPSRLEIARHRLGRITLFGFLFGLLGCVGLVITFFTLGR